MFAVRITPRNKVVDWNQLCCAYAAAAFLLRSYSSNLSTFFRYRYFMSCRFGASPVVVAGAQQLQRKKEKHSTHQNLNHVKENISTIDTKAAEAVLSEQMKQEPEKLLNDILSHPSKQKRRIAKYTPTKNTKISEVRPRRSKQQPRLDNNPVHRVENSPDDSKKL